MDCVTGAYSFTGRFIAQALIARGEALRTLTNHPRPLNLGSDIDNRPLQFADERQLRASLEGIDVLYNTYWVRFNAMGARFDDAVANIGRLLDAARRAGVRRVVHVSVSNCRPDDTLAYYRAKAEAEELVRRSDLEFTIVRPTLIFAEGDILLNNIAWLLRRLPIFAIAGSGDYRLQPVAGTDVGEICAWAGRDAPSASEVDAAGPEVYTYSSLVDLVRGAVGSRSPVIHVDRRVALLAVRLLGLVVDDLILTEEELGGLEREKLLSHEPARGRTSFKGWIEENAERLGRSYASERRRHFAG